MHKPNGQTVVPLAGVPCLLRDLPVPKLRQLGGKFGASVMEKLGVSTVGGALHMHCTPALYRCIYTCQLLLQLGGDSWGWNLSGVNMAYCLPSADTNICCPGLHDRHMTAALVQQLLFRAGGL